MPVTNFTCNKDARIARRESDNYDSGAGTGAGLAYGLYSGYRYRALLGFSINMAGWTSITSAVLNYKSSNQINVAFGSDPTMLVQRLSAAWSEGSAASLSSSNAVVYPGPGAYSTNQVEEDAPTGENTWGAVDITAMMRDALAAGVFHGVRILGSTNTPGESDSATNVGEIYSRESGSGTAYITINYETNRAPDAPSISSPDVANGGLVGTTTPALHVYMTDPDGNAINNYHWQIDDNADFSSPIQDVYPGAAGASGVTAVVVPAALARGGTYYFRAQAADVSVWGGWSGTFSFKVASLPTLTVSEPSASGRLARLTYSAGSGWGSPRMLVNWDMTCPDGGSQASWRLELYNDSAGAPVGMIEDITVNDTQASRVIPYNLIEGNYYHVRVTTTCSHGLTTVVGFTRVRARWGLAIYTADMGAAAIGSLTLASLDVTDETNGGQGRVVTEYQTVAAPGTPSTWAATIGGAGLNRYFYYRVWLLTWGASPAVSPTLNQLNITYTTAIIVPDKWQVSDPNNVTGDVSSFVYGTKSLRMKGIANWLLAHQQIAVIPNTYYVLSGRIQTSGPVLSAYIGFASNSSGGGDLNNASVDATKAIAFENPASRVATTPWFSGSNTSVWVRLSSHAPVGTSVWFDAIKMEASTVVTPWSPGYVANAVVLDAGGLQIDASNGGIFRLRGSAGGARDIVEVGANGLKFGGDTELLSPALRRLETRAGLFNSFNYSVGDRGDGNLSVIGDGSSANKWAKIASGVLSGQYWSQGIKGTVMHRYGASEVDVLVASDAGFTAQPAPVGVYSRQMYGAGGTVRFRVVVESLNPIVWSLWFQTPSAWTSFVWFPETGYGEGPSVPTIVNPAVLGWQTATPAGTNYDDVPGMHGAFSASQAAIGGGFWGALSVNGQMSATSIHESGVRLIQPAGQRIQMGTANPNTDAFVTVTFPVPFSGVPIVAAWPLNFNWYCGSNGTAPTASNFIVGVKRPGQAGGAGCPVQWIAIGPA